jgi:DNA transformation protein
MPRPRSAFIDDVIDRLAPLEARARGMFSGHGVYVGEVMMGLIVDDRLYFKTGDGNRADYEARGMEPYSYGRSGGRRIAMSYHEVPPDLLEDSDLLIAWAHKAIAAARQAAPDRRRGTSRSRNKSR